MSGINLTDREKKEILECIKSGKQLKDKYRFKLFEGGARAGAPKLNCCGMERQTMLLTQFFRFSI